MDAPDLREMVARAINRADNEWADAPRTMPHEAWPQHVADAVLSVPGIADALAARAEGSMTKDEYRAASQRWVDEVCYYRNLAIANGAKPNEMLNGTDRKLCEAGLSIVEPFDERTEIIELWEVADSAEAALARDAKVAEIVALTTDEMGDESEQPMSYTAADGFDSIAALYPEAGK